MNIHVISSRDLVIRMVIKKQNRQNNKYLNVLYLLQEWCDEILKYATNLLAQNGSVLTYLEKSYTKLTHVFDVNGRIPVKK